MIYTLKLEETEVNLVGAALQELPFKLSAALIAKLHAQISAQQAANEAKPVEPVELKAVPTGDAA